MFTSLLIGMVLVTGREIIENVIGEIDTPDKLKANSTFSGVEIIENLIRLRNKEGAGSFVSLKDPLKEKEWSVEVSTNNIKLDDMERAGLYVWYSAKEVEMGSFKGVNPVFNGMMIGIELHDSRAELVMTYNDGTEDEKTMYISRDKISHYNMDLASTLKLKVIHTRKNFKIELWCDNQLVSDTLKADTELSLDDIPDHNHYIGITTEYKDTPKWATFYLENLTISRRQETEDYNPRHSKTKINGFSRRKSDDEVRHTAAEISHVMAYLTSLIGTEEPNELERLFLSISDALREIASLVQKGIDNVKKRDYVSKSIQKKDISERMKNLSIEVDKTEKSIFDLRLKLDGMRDLDSQKSLARTRLLYFTAFGIFCMTAARYIQSILKTEITAGNK